MADPYIPYGQQTSIDRWGKEALRAQRSQNEALREAEFSPRSILNEATKTAFTDTVDLAGDVTKKVLAENLLKDTEGADKIAQYNKLENEIAATTGIMQANEDAIRLAKAELEKIPPGQQEGLRNVIESEIYALQKENRDYTKSLSINRTTLTNLKRTASVSRFIGEQDKSKQLRANPVMEAMRLARRVPKAEPPAMPQPVAPAMSDPIAQSISGSRVDSTLTPRDVIAAAPPAERTATPDVVFEDKNVNISIDDGKRSPRVTTDTLIAEVGVATHLDRLNQGRWPDEYRLTAEDLEFMKMNPRYERLFLEKDWVGIANQYANEVYFRRSGQMPTNTLSTKTGSL